MTSTPGPAVDLIEYAAQIIVAKMQEPGTAPYHWAGALWEAGMLVGPGSPTPTGPEPAIQRYEPCVTDASGRCTRWSHDHPVGPATPEPTEETK